MMMMMLKLIGVSRPAFIIIAIIITINDNCRTKTLRGFFLRSVCHFHHQGISRPPSPSCKAGQYKVTAMAKVIADDRVPSPSSQSGLPLPNAYQAFIIIVIVIVVIVIVVIVIVIIVIVIVVIVVIIIASSSLSLLLSVFV